ncbi:flagellar basal body rod protein FlgB [Pleionea sp. CnH1-48]|uniref:flagellar basal body rod protein FlgB n=1 Tax=Pleionea sp. CnH1-48 TaxID=2954494 RepID=UPI0020978F36|nr:flagellar basal body rod protein FlgB [Pleionea sp. CnH1-48]MCO7226161.1 flagellar basal body rod protein FlgB [Pleionea sp. CnH1-48]
MAINFEKALGVHESALTVRAKRAEVLANNLANAETPGFRAQDIDFRKAMDNALNGNKGGLLRTHEKHFDSGASSFGPGALQYRTPEQPDTGNGNSVDSQKEQARFAENALQYQATLTFLGSRFKGLTKAIRGE